MGDRILRVGTFNIRHGLGADGRIDLPRTAHAISCLACDLVALQEVDVVTERSSGVDQRAVLSAECGMTGCFGSALPLQGGHYGNAILSRLPIRRQHVIALPGTEPRCLLAAEVAWHGHTICFCSVHLDLDPVMRNKAVEQLLDGRFLRGPEAMIVAGDFNTTPSEAPMQRLRDTWSHADSASLTPTYPADKPDRRIDAIFVTAGTGWHWLSEEVVDDAVTSDHRPVQALLEHTAI